MPGLPFYRRAVFGQLGFEPNSNAIKPVHVANGLARAVAGFYGDAQPLHDVVRLKSTGGARPQPPIGIEVLREAPYFVGCDDSTISAIRTALNELVTADHAVLGLPNFSSYTLSHQLFATSDVRDAGLGVFLWQLLRGHSAKESPALGALTQILGRDLTSASRDDLTTAVLPLLDPRITQKAPPTEAVSSAVAAGRVKNPTTVLGWIKNGMDIVAAREAGTSQLLLLRRLILLGAVGVHVHMVQWEAEINPDLTPPIDYCPILLDLTGDPASPMAEASRDSCQLAKNYVDTLARFLLRLQLEEEWAGRDLHDGRTLRAVVADLAEDEVAELYADNRAEFEDPLDALADALFLVGSAKESVVPSEFARYLAQRSGFIGPRQGRGRKGYRISLELLEILTLATVPPGEIWPVPRVLQAWWDRFGIVIGGRDGDMEVLAAYSIDRLTQDDLDWNTERLVGLLEEQGLAKRYGDGVRQIGQF